MHLGTLIVHMNVFCDDVQYSTSRLLKVSTAGIRWVTMNEMLLTLLDEY